jgi:ectoine hydroxylase-related dioxygenase (phytanoyl-CoA dioxygenase family)
MTFRARGPQGTPFVLAATQTSSGFDVTRNGPENGGLTVWPLDGRGPQQVALDPGDVLVMDPKLPHASGPNRTGSIRYCVYLRFLAQ